MKEKLTASEILAIRPNTSVTWRMKSLRAIDNARQLVYRYKTRTDINYSVSVDKDNLKITISRE